MKIFSHRQSLDHRWQAVTLAHFKKYPNPFAAHVLSTDIIERHVDERGRLVTKRLLLKTGVISSLPARFQAMIPSREAYIVEESTVDPQEGTMEVRTRNLSHRRLLSVEEIQLVRGVSGDEVRGSSSLGGDGRPPTTTIETRAKFHCSLPRWNGLAASLEHLGVRRFGDHLKKSRMALLHVIEQIRTASKTGGGLSL